MIVIILLIGGFFALTKINKNSPHLTLYFLDTCPHCIIVEDFIKQNNIDGKLKIEKKAIYHDVTIRQTLEDEINKEKDKSKISQLKQELAKEQALIKIAEDNSNELGSIAAKCKIDKNNIGVPFLWDGEKCYTGDKDIIAFFKQKAGI